MPIWVDIVIAVTVFIIGTLFGSFFTLATYRIPRKQDIVFKRSYCPTCQHELGFFDLIPVLSFLFAGGSCRYCKEKISIRYPLFEVLSGFTFLLTYLVFGFSLYFFMAIVIYIYLFLLTGCYIMQSKMIKQEMKELQNENKVVAKSGVFLVELIVAAILFIVFMTSSYITSRNYIHKGVQSMARSNAVTTCVKNLEVALAVQYNDLNSYTTQDVINNIAYTTTISVYRYADEYTMKEDYIKKVNAKITYLLDGKEYSYQIDTLKKKVVQ